MTDWLDNLNALGQQNANGAEPDSNRFRSCLYQGRAVLELPEPGWLIDGILPAEAFTLLYGPKGNGKSFVAVDMSMSIALGHPWAGHPTHQGPVLYVVAEGAAGIGKRSEAWLEHHHLDTDYPITWWTRRVNLGDVAQTSELIEIAAEIQPVLVVIDTLARCNAGGDENSPKDMGQVVDSLDRIRETVGTATMPVHHAGKDLSKGARGHTTLLGATDAVLQVTGGDRRIRVQNEKDAEPAAPLNFQMVDAGRSVALDAYDAAITAPESVGIVLRTLDEIASEDGIALTNWQHACDEAGVSRATFWRAKKFLEITQQIENRGTVNRPKFVRLFDADDQASE